MSMLLFKLVPTGMAVVMLPSTLAVNAATAHANALLAVPTDHGAAGIFLQPWFAAITTVLFGMCSHTRSCSWLLFNVHRRHHHRRRHRTIAQIALPPAASFDIPCPCGVVSVRCC